MRKLVSEMPLKNQKRMKEITDRLTSYVRIEGKLQRRTGKKPTVFSKEKESLKEELSKLRREARI